MASDGIVSTPEQASPPGDWALLVVDMQNDFLDRAGYYARRARLQRRPEWARLSSEEQRRLLEAEAPSRGRGARSRVIDSVVDNVCRAIAAARAADRPVVFVRAVYDRGFEILPPLLRNDPGRAHFPCRPGTWGAELFGAVAEAAAPAGHVIEKHTYDAFSNPRLLELLRSSGTDTVILCGTETQVCVLATAQHAALLGFRSFILEDGVWSANLPMANAALAIFRDAFGGTTTVDELNAPTSGASG